MSVHIFLRSIWPLSGKYYAFFSIRPDIKLRKTHWVNPHDEADITQLIQSSREQHQNLFVAVASFTERKRKQQTTQYLKTLFVDLDVGEGKPYNSQTAAITDLIRFCTQTKFPKPTWVVNSGNGIQCYWVGDSNLDRVQWFDMATRFHDLCVTHKLHIDPAVTKDSARVLRVPTSLHCKDLNNPKEVTILMQNPECSWAEITTRLPTNIQLPSPAAPAPHMSMTLAIGQISDTPKSFAQIIKRTLQEHGCPFLLQAARFNRSLSEPAWRAALSIAKFCEDAEEAAYVVSAEHPGYSLSATQDKLNGIEGPYRCSTIQDLEEGRKACSSCIHRGKISSPIVLGAIKHIAQPPGTSTGIPDTEPSPVVESAPVEDHPLNVVLNNEPAQAHNTNIPYPYFHAEDGYTYKRISTYETKEAIKRDIPLFNGADGATAVRAYNGLVRLVGRAYDPYLGEEIAQIVVSRGRDENRFTKIPMCDIGGKETLRKSLKQGAILNDREASTIQDYLSKAIVQDKEHSRAVPAVNCGGWSEDLSTFVYGRWALHKDKQISNVIPVAGMDGITRTMQVRGKARHWIRMAEYWNKPRHNVMAFTLLTAFGAPLMKLLELGTAGALIHLFSPESGVGKSAVQNMICAVYGNPRLMIMTPQDTINSMMSLIGTYCNTPICIDEITNHPAEEVSRLVYQFSQGREKTRMDANMNIRATSGDWNTLIVSSGNASLVDKLCAIKASPDGELMRFLELRPESLDINDPLSNVMTGIYDNYGSVGAQYLYNIVTNPEIVRQEIQYVKNIFAQHSTMGQSHRFWSALCIANIAGGRLAKRLGFINYDMDAMAHWIIDTVENIMSGLEARLLHGSNMFGNILSALSGHTITIPEQGIPILPHREPLALVDIRNRKVSISVSALNKIASSQQISVTDVTTRMKDYRYQFVGQTVTNIAAGVATSLPPMTVPVYEYLFKGTTDV